MDSEEARGPSTDPHETPTHSSSSPLLQGPFRQAGTSLATLGGPPNLLETPDPLRYHDHRPMQSNAALNLNIPIDGPALRSISTSISTPNINSGPFSTLPSAAAASSVSSVSSLASSTLPVNTARNCFFAKAAADVSQLKTGVNEIKRQYKDLKRDFESYQKEHTNLLGTLVQLREETDAMKIFFDEQVVPFIAQTTKRIEDLIARVVRLDKSGIGGKRSQLEDDDDDEFELEDDDEEDNELQDDDESATV